MRAAMYYGPGRLEIEDVPEPQLKADNMVIKIRGCTICGTDLKFYTVGNPRCKPPRIIGHELVGEVVGVGSAVDGFVVGDRVTFATSIGCKRCDYCVRGLENLCPRLRCIAMDFDGAFAEYMEAPPEAIRGGNAIRVPDTVADKAAALSEPLSCVINAEKIAGVKPGDAMVVIGAGPLGCLCAEVGKAFGARRVIITQTSPERRALAAQLERVEIVDASQGNAVEQVRAMTGGEGADVIMVAAPSVAAQSDALRMARKGGVVSLFASLPQGASAIEIDTRIVHYGQISIVGASDSRPRDVRDALGLLAAGKINVNAIVTHEIPLTRLLDGIELMKQRSGLKLYVKP